MSRIVKDGSTAVFKREVPSTCGGGSDPCLDANGQPLRVNSSTNDTSETFSYDADRYFLKSADPVSYGTTSPYQAQDWTYTAGALGLRETAKNVFPPFDHWHLATNTYVAGTSRVHETLTAEFYSDGTPNPEFDRKTEYGYAPNGTVNALTMYQRPSGQTTGWETPGTYNLGLDEEGRLTQLLAESTYDHRWLRTRRVVDEQPVDFWHAGSGELFMELDCPASGDCEFCTEEGADAGSPTCALTRPSQEYVWLDGAPIAMIEADLRWDGSLDDSSSTVKFIHPGLLGEPRRVTDSAKNVVWVRDLPPFGFAGQPSENQQTVGGVTTTLHLGLPGQYQDPEGMYYNWHRVYDPATGQYWSADPLVGTGADGRSYTYAAYRPTSTIDPSGLFEEAADATLVVVILFSAGAYIALDHAIRHTEWRFPPFPLPDPPPVRDPVRPPEPAPPPGPMCPVRPSPRFLPPGHPPKAGKQCNCFCLDDAGRRKVPGLGRMHEFDCRSKCAMSNGGRPDVYICD